jgi:glycosyltransferase involved in cell wall biosynthesis
VSARTKVLIVITLAETGGAQTYVAGLLPALAERFDCVVAAHGPGPLRDAARAAGARFVALRQVRRDLSPWHDALGVLELLALVRRERPALVHVNSSKAGVLGRIAAALGRVPVRVFTVHGWAHAAAAGRRSDAYRWADRMMAPLTTLTICVAENERRSGLAARTCRPERTVVIPNAVDVRAAQPAALAGRPPRLVWVGRLAEPKDPFTLVDALALLRGVPLRLEIIGDGPLRAAVEERVHRCGLEDVVTFAGLREDVPARLAAADAFVLSSHSEGAPMCLLEAMAAGLPIVATAAGGVAELVDDGVTGVLVPPADPERLARALEAVATDPGLRRRLGAAGRVRALERFDLAGFRSAHLRAYDDALARAGVPTMP